MVGFLKKPFPYKWKTTLILLTWNPSAKFICGSFFDKVHRELSVF